MRPIFVALGCAEALQQANRWHRPSLEEWDAIEKQLDQEDEAARGAPERRRARPKAAGGDKSSSDDSGDDDDGDDGDGGSDGGSDAGGSGDAANAGQEEEEEEYYPERIIKHRAGTGGPAAKVEGREFQIKWSGYGVGKLDVTWELQRELIDDGNALHVHRYLQENPSLKRPDGLDAAVAAELVELGEASDAMAMGDGDGDGNTAAPPPLQPEIGHVDLAAVVQLLTTPIGGEKDTGKKAAALKANASVKERRYYEAMHIENPETGEMVHKTTAFALAQRCAVDAKPGAGHAGRYATSERQPIVAEDRDGSGFACDQVYELYVDATGAPLNSSAELLLDG